MAKGHADDLVAHQRGPAAVARVDRGVNLHTQAGRRVVIAGELDARDNALGNREAGAAGGEPVDEHRILDDW